MYEGGYDSKYGSHREDVVEMGDYVVRIMEDDV